MGKFFLLTIGAVAIAAMVFGITLVGGPSTTRQDKIDKLRLDDLNTIYRILTCAFKADVVPLDDSLPETLTVTGLSNIRDNCVPSNPRITEESLTDDETGEPYTYTRNTNTDFTLCASFYNAERAIDQNSYVFRNKESAFDTKTGCASGSVPGRP